jgi:hypothetical protein
VLNLFLGKKNLDWDLQQLIHDEAKLTTK